MHPVLDGPRHSAPRASWHDPRTCPECMGSFQPVDGGQLFCSTVHRRAWNNRWVTRGAVIAPLVAVARITRNGSRGSTAGRTYGARAGIDADTLFRRWRAEDAAAGRMVWDEYLARRYQLGFDPT